MFHSTELHEIQEIYLKNFKCTNGVVKGLVVTFSMLILEVVVTKYLLFQEETSWQTESKAVLPHSIDTVLLFALPVNNQSITHEKCINYTSTSAQYNGPDSSAWVKLQQCLLTVFVTKIGTILPMKFPSKLLL
jgi:hypothetical protein